VACALWKRQDSLAVEAALAKVAATIIDDFVPSCSLKLPSALGIDPDKVNLEFRLHSTSQVIPRVSSAAQCGSGEGWYYDNPVQPTQIDLCPATCSRIRQNVRGTL